jgi:glycosyltransferase, group 1 family protein
MRILEILSGPSYDSVIAYKDAGMLLYELNKSFNYTTNYCGCNSSEYDATWNPQFLKSVCVTKISESLEFNQQELDIKKYIKDHIISYDAVIFFNYGNTTYKLAEKCKQINPKIVVYVKLDMGRGGYAHFSPSRAFSFLRSRFEAFKSRNVDFFTVETKEYYNTLKDTPMFKGRLYYLPNGVSTLGIDDTTVNIDQKENIVITVGRLGIYEKNTELFLNSILEIPDKIRSQWKFYFVGPQTKEFSLYIKEFLKDNPMLAPNIVQLGNITDRNELSNLLKKSKIICMPSRTESTCIATLEGMYFGCVPIISRYSAFVKDTTNNESIGKVVDDYSSSSFARALVEYMNDEIRLKSEVEKAISYARNTFDYKTIGAELNRLLMLYRKRLVK